MHGILDRMSAENNDAKLKPKDVKGIAADSENEEDAGERALQHSKQMSAAMQTTARLWSRSAQEWPDDGIDMRSTTFNAPLANASSAGRRRGAQTKSRRHPGANQSFAYIAWKEASVKDWVKQLQRGSHPPNKEQMAFLIRVIDRCREESKNLRNPKLKTYSDEPVRDFLLGIPGSGKSTCIKLMRRFFEECLKWEDGVQFQFLASQNTMAALIGGKTVHSWGTIPVNATDAANKLQTKGVDGDVEELYLNALGMRWIIIDETSTLSPSLLGMLDTYLRRACCRHPYARAGKRRRPFGGINLVLGGDLWQLPPVRSNAIFSNPFKSGYSAEEQKIMKMIWRKDDVDSIQKTFVLTQPMRTDDPWLISLLEASRCGRETWEMYCFNHGLPTRNPGSWLPGLNSPACKKQHMRSFSR